MVWVLTSSLSRHSFLIRSECMYLPFTITILSCFSSPLGNLSFHNGCLPSLYGCYPTIQSSRRYFQLLSKAIKTSSLIEMNVSLTSFLNKLTIFPKLLNILETILKSIITWSKLFKSFNFRKKFD